MILYLFGFVIACAISLILISLTITFYIYHLIYFFFILDFWSSWRERDVVKVMAIYIYLHINHMVTIIIGHAGTIAT